MQPARTSAHGFIINTTCCLLLLCWTQLSPFHSGTSPLHECLHHWWTMRASFHPYNFQWWYAYSSHRILHIYIFTSYIVQVYNTYMFIQMHNNNSYIFYTLYKIFCSCSGLCKMMHHFRRIIVCINRLLDHLPCIVCVSQSSRPCVALESTRQLIHTGDFRSERPRSAQRCTILTFIMQVHSKMDVLMTSKVEHSWHHRIRHMP